MQSLSILVVDDDKNIVFTLGEILKLNNWAVDIAEDGYKAVELAKTHKYDLVLLDVKMPGIDGIQTFGEIRKLQPDAIVFFMTAGAIDNLVDLQQKGVSTIIQKPIDVTKIVSMISNFEKKGVVMVVDDNENDRNLLSEILQEKGYKVLAAQTGAEAIDMTMKNDFDVVILDIKLPDMDGLTVLERIKKVRPSSSIITVTGYCLDELIEDITGKGAYTCLLKPFDVDLLLKEINGLINKRVAGKPSGAEDNKASILVVEDDNNIRGTMVEVLVEEGYSVSGVSSIKKAGEELEKSNFDVVISDLSIGKESGLSLVDVARKKDKTLVFLLLTGQGSLETAVEAVKMNVDEYILKPIKPADLIHKVKSYLEKQKLAREKEFLITQLQQSNMRLYEMAKIDELTGLYNRRHLFEQLHAEMQRSKRQKTPLCLMMCDIDGFKKYNDTYGHPEGDKILKDITLIIKNMVRRYVDQTFRYGGDEIAVVVPGLDQDHAMSLAWRIVDAVGEKMKAHNVGISIGIGCFEVDTVMTLNELVDLADRKLYEAKRAGKNQVVL